MSILPSISLRRVWLVARRDYLGYVKTWGFWISFFLPFIFGILGFAAATAGVDLTTTRYEAVLDETGQGIGEDILADWRSERLAKYREELSILPEVARAEALKEMETRQDTDLVFVDPPANTMEDLQPWLRGEQLLNVDDKTVPLSGLLQIYIDSNNQTRARYWSRNVNSIRVPGIARNYFQKQSRAEYLEAAGLNLSGLAEASTVAPIDVFDPTKALGEDEEAQAVTRTDQIPYFIAAAASAFLWLTVFSGAYMLLTSMLEEKLGKLMEMMLATTQFGEIMLGKLVGVAMLTITAMAPYILLAVAGIIAVMTLGPPEVVEGVRQAVTLKMLIFFPVFLILGYVLYGSLFIALGSLSESMQDAQTLTVPIMIVLTVCVLVVPAGLDNPNAPLVVFASWFPLSAPFAAIVRVPADPSWLTLIGSALLMLVTTILISWLASRIFRHGILSGSGVKPLGAWFRRTVLRQKDLPTPSA
jgi:ABC-2 type transport system permease protein